MWTFLATLLFLSSLQSCVVKLLALKLTEHWAVAKSHALAWTKPSVANS